MAFSMRLAWWSISSAQASTISMSASSWLQEVRYGIEYPEVSIPRPP